MAFEQLFCGASAVADKLSVDLARNTVQADAYYSQPLPTYRHKAGTIIRVWLNQRLPENGFVSAGAMFSSPEGSKSGSLGAVVFCRAAMPDSIFQQLLAGESGFLLLIEFENVDKQIIRIAAKRSLLAGCGLSCTIPRREVTGYDMKVIENLTFLFNDTATIECSDS